MKKLLVIAAVLWAGHAMANDATAIECADQSGDVVKFTVQAEPPFEVGKVEVVSAYLYPPSGQIRHPNRIIYTDGGNSSGVQVQRMTQRDNYYELLTGDKWGAFEYALNIDNTLIDPGHQSWGKLMLKYAGESTWIDQRAMNCQSSEAW